MSAAILSSLARRAPALASRRFSQPAARSFVSRTLPTMDDELPYHIVMGMPALSPTMEAGALAEWYFKEGDSFIAGDAIAKIETDKASIDFEAQDDGYVAKLLVEAGTGDEITVGTPIMVTVEEGEDVAAFANYTAPAAAEAPKPAAAAAPEPAAPTPTPPPPPPAPKVEAAAPPPPPPPPAAPAAPPAAAPIPAAAQMASASMGWGKMARTKSPLAKTLGKQQALYQEKYGSTGQIPL